jgi:hypothetical protein
MPLTSPLFLFFGLIPLRTQAEEENQQSASAAINNRWS